MFGMMNRQLIIYLLLALVPVFSYANNQSCTLNVEEAKVVSLLETAVIVKVGKHQVLIPVDPIGFEFKVSEGRGQFEFQIAGEGSGSKPDQQLKESTSWNGLYSIVFTNQVAIDLESEIFQVAHKCSLGDIPVLYIGMKGLDISLDESNIVLLELDGGASFLLFGDSFGVYLEALKRANE